MDPYKWWRGGISCHFRRSESDVTLRSFLPFPKSHFRLLKSSELLRKFHSTDSDGRRRYCSLSPPSFSWLLPNANVMWIYLFWVPLFFFPLLANGLICGPVCYKFLKKPFSLFLIKLGSSRSGNRIDINGKSLWGTCGLDGCIHTLLRKKKTIQT